MQLVARQRNGSRLQTGTVSGLQARRHPNRGKKDTAPRLGPQRRPPSNRQPRLLTATRRWGACAQRNPKRPRDQGRAAGARADPGPGPCPLGAARGRAEARPPAAARGIDKGRPTPRLPCHTGGGKVTRQLGDRNPETVCPQNPGSILPGTRYPRNGIRDFRLRRRGSGVPGGQPAIGTEHHASPERTSGMAADPKRGLSPDCRPGGTRTGKRKTRHSQTRAAKAASQQPAATAANRDAQVGRVRTKEPKETARPGARSRGES